ncbi:MAG: hypothetical protein VYD87_08140 [Pseudomonadota bacterium]|nr:hypothetical protein [Pseudomonadota bacterium]MEE3099412.1 hypothetical protein [Pseudomonadota bacterium]
MKIAGGRIRGFAARPDPAAVAILLHGPDALEIDDLRVRLSSTLLRAAGEGAEITAMDPGEVRRDPAALRDALRSGGLFGGRPVVVVEGAADGVTDAVSGAIEGLTPGEGALLVTAGQLNARSKLRKLFEDSGSCAALAIYPQVLDRGGLEAMLSDAGLDRISDGGRDALLEVAANAEPAEIRALVWTLALYALDATSPLEATDVLSLAPENQDGDVDAVVDAVLARQPGPALAAHARLAAKGPSATSLALALGRQFRQLHALAAAPDGPEAAVGRMRPPLYGPRRDAMLRAARGWPMRLCEAALTMILEAELGLRSSAPAPERAAAERLIVRLATMRP